MVLHVPWKNCVQRNEWTHVMKCATSYSRSSHLPSDREWSNSVPLIYLCVSRGKCNPQNLANNLTGTITTLPLIHSFIICTGFSTTYEPHVSRLILCTHFLITQNCASQSQPCLCLFNRRFQLIISTLNFFLHMTISVCNWAYHEVLYMSTDWGTDEVND